MATNFALHAKGFGRLHSLPPMNPYDLRRQLPEAVLRKIELMDDLTQQAFLAEFRKKRKSAFLAFLLFMSIPSFHYFYLGKVWLNLIFWATMGGFGVWWLIDLFRVLGMVREYNKSVGIQVLRDIQVLS